MGRRRRERTPQTIRDYVRAGILHPLQPTTSSGTTSYGIGRAVDTDSAFSFTLPAAVPNAGGAVAYREVMQFPSGAGSSDEFFRLGAVHFGWQNNTRCARMTSTGGAPSYSVSGVRTWSTGQIYSVLARWTDTTHDIDIDGTSATQAARTGTAVPGDTFALETPGTYRINVGPIVVFFSRPTNADVAAFQAQQANLWSSIPALVCWLRDHDYSAVIIPFIDNSVAYRLGTLPAPGAVGKVGLRFDDCPSADYTLAYPALAARGLVGGFAVVQDYVGETGNCSLVQLLEMQAGGMEMMCHSRTHGSNPTDLATFTDQSATSADEMRALGLNVVSFVQPGTWNAWSGDYAMVGSSFWGKPAEVVLRENFDAYESYESYVGGAFRSLPIAATERWGGAHEGGTSETVDDLCALIDDAASFPCGVEILNHSARIGLADNLTEDDFTTFLDYLKDAVDDGRVTNPLPTDQLTQE